MESQELFASDVTSGTWSVYDNSSGSYDTGEFVLLTVRKNITYSAKCSTLNNKNLAVDFMKNSISPVRDGSLIFIYKYGNEKIQIHKC